jgi:Toprim domain-containing protein
VRPKTLDDLTGPWKRTTQIVYRDCPMCGRDNWKLYLSPDTGLWKCFGCNAAGRLDLGHTNALALLHVKSQAAPSWAPMDLPPFKALSAAAHDHLGRKYGLTPEQCARYSLVEGAAEPYIGRILVPYFNQAGEIIYYTGRSYIGETPKYKAADGKHPLFVPMQAFGTWPGNKPPVYLVEGTFDAIKLYEAGFWLAAAIGGTGLPRHLLPSLMKLADNAIEIVIALDSDALDKALALQRRLQPFVAGEVRVVMLPPGQDPGSMSIDQLQEVLS